MMGGIGDQVLIVQQLRELGYKGLLIGPNSGDPAPMVEIAGAAACEGFLTNDPDYADTSTHAQGTVNLYNEFHKRYPNDPLTMSVVNGFGGIMVYKQAIEKAGSIDPDQVMKVFNDPTWTYEWFGEPGHKFGGLETFGIARVNADLGCVSI